MRRHDVASRLCLVCLAWSLAPAQPSAEPPGGGTAATQTVRSSPDVRSFGAVGDGVADDTAALRRAIAGGVSGIRLSRGDYRITQTLRVELDDVNRFSITGDGTGTIIMESAGPAIALIGRHEGTAFPPSVLPATWNRQRSPLIGDIEIVGRHPEADGIEIRGTMQPTIRGVNIRETRDAITMSHNNRNVIITGCNLFNNSGRGILFDHVNQHQTLIGDCHLFGNRGGGVVVLGGNVRNVHIGNCDIESNMPNELTVDGDGTASNAANVLLDIETTAGDGMSKDPEGTDPHTNTIAEVTIAGCTLQHTRKSPSGANLRILGRPGYPINTVSITGNVMSDAAVNVELNHARAVTFSGNHLLQAYPHDVLVRRSEQISFTGDQIASRLYEGERQQQDGCLIESSRGVTMTGVQFNQMLWPEGALRIDDCRQVHLLGCLFRDCRRGIVLNRSSMILVTGCSATGTDEDGEDLEIIDCRDVRSQLNLFDRDGSMP